MLWRSLVFFAAFAACLIIFPPLLFIIFPAGIVYLFSAGLQLNKEHNRFMENFAKEQGFEYKLYEADVVDTVTGRLLTKVPKHAFLSKESLEKIEAKEKRSLFVRHNLQSQPIRNISTGEHRGFPIRMFNFSYRVSTSMDEKYGSGFTIRSGRKRARKNKSYNFTVCEMSVTKTDFPFLLLLSQANWRSDLTELVEAQDIEINIGPQFEKTFRLFTRQGYAIEALQIFTDEVLSFLQTEAPNFSIEFAGNKVYLYDDHIVNKKEDMDQMLSVLRKMIDTTGDFLNRLHDDYESLHEAYRR